MDAYLLQSIPYAAAVAVAGGALLWREIRKAPEGYEDASGFNYGPEPAEPVALPAHEAIDWHGPLELVYDAGRIVIAVKCNRPHPKLYGREVEAVDGSNWWVLDNGKIPGTRCYIRNGVAPVAKNDNVPTLTREQAAVLFEMHADISYTAAELSEQSGVPEKTVTKVRKELRALGLAEYGTQRSEGGDGHEVAGRGYWLTAAGLDAQRRLIAAQTVAA